MNITAPILSFSGGNLHAVGMSPNAPRAASGVKNMMTTAQSAEEVTMVATRNGSDVRTSAGHSGVMTGAKILPKSSMKQQIISARNQG